MNCPSHDTPIQKEWTHRNGDTYTLYTCGCKFGHNLLNTQAWAELV